MIEPGHRGLVFDRHQGLSHEVLTPGYHALSSSERIEDFDVTYTTSREAIHVMTSEGLEVDVSAAIIHRPIIAELYELETEVGRGYYINVVEPELRSAARHVAAHHGVLDFVNDTTKIEDEIEAELRRRIAGKHVEISSVTFQTVKVAPELVAAMRNHALHPN